MKISIIVAMGLHRQIGIGGKIPWHLSADLQNFKKLTLGHTLILGRKTFDSIGKALPGRKTIVLTRDGKFSAESCMRASSFSEAVRIAEDSGESEVFIAGGAEVYKSSLELAHRIYLSFVNYDGEADTFFPPFSLEGWKKIQTETFPETEKGPSWRFELWERA